MKNSNIYTDVRILGPIGTNVYLVVNKENKEAVLIDPAGEPERIEQMVRDNDAQLKAVLITHGHYDHILAAEDIRKKLNVKLYAGEDEAETLSDEEINLSAGFKESVSLSADVWLKDNENVVLAGMKIRAIHTPGHTAGGMSYYFEDAGMLFCGDTLFCESVGRTDFPGGSMSQIVRSIKDKLFLLPDETICYPGHGEGTSIKHEKVYNSFCR